MSETTEIIINGRVMHVEAGITLASALVNAQESVFRRSTTGEPRAPLCGMGICYECRVTIDGMAHQRSCMIVVEAGMRVDTESASR